MNKKGPLYTAVANISKFLRESDLEKCTPNILEIIGRGSSVDRVYLFENHRDQNGDIFCSQRFEWVANGIPSQIDNPNLQNFSWHDNGFEDWLDLLRKGNPIAGLTSHMAESKRQVLYDMQGILSIVLVLVIVEKSLWGCIGFADCTKERRWTVPEIDALRMTGSVTASLIEKERLRAKEVIEVKKPQRIIATCSYCKKVRDEQGRWYELEKYFTDKWHFEFSHGICPDCLEQYKSQLVFPQSKKQPPE